MFTAKDEESSQLQKVNDEAKKNLLELASKYQELLAQIDELQNSLNDLKQKYTEKAAQAETEKQRYETQINEYIQNEKTLSTQVIHFKFI